MCVCVELNRYFCRCSQSINKSKIPSAVAAAAAAATNEMNMPSEADIVYENARNMRQRSVHSFAKPFPSSYTFSYSNLPSNFFVSAILRAAFIKSSSITYPRSTRIANIPASVQTFLKSAPLNPSHNFTTLS